MQVSESEGHMGQPRIDADHELDEVKSLLPGKGPGVMEQVPEHAYDPPVMRVEDSWNPETLRLKVEKLDKERKIAS